MSEKEEAFSNPSTEEIRKDDEQKDLFNITAPSQTEGREENGPEEEEQKRETKKQENPEVEESEKENHEEEETKKELVEAEEKMEEIVVEQEVVTAEEEKEETVADIVNRLMNNDPVEIVDPDSVSEVIEELQRQSNAKLLQHEVEFCEKADKIIDALREYQIVQRKLQAQRDYSGAYEDKLQKSHDDMVRLQGSIEETKRNLQQKHKKAYEELVKRHKEEMKNLKKELQSPTSLRPYNRASSKLQAMRKQSSVLLAQREYVQLKEYDQKIKAQEEREEAERYRSLKRHYHTQIHNLKVKQQREMEVLKMAQDGRERTFRVTANAEMEKAKRRIAAVEIDKHEAQDPDKVWCLHHRHESVPMSRASIRLKKPEPSPEEITTLRLPPLGRRRVKSGMSRAQTSKATRC